MTGKTRREPKSIRLDPEVIERMENLRRAMARRSKFDVNEASVYRAVIGRGLEALEREVGVRKR